MDDEAKPTGEERRAKREARRANNVDRAAEMHAARTAWEADSDSAEEFHVGCSGWFYWHWLGGFYPAELKTSGWFEHYPTPIFRRR